MSPGARIDYKTLRQINPEAARKAVLEYLKTNGGNKADAAKVFGVNRTVVYDILKKAGEGDLRDRPKTPKHQPNKTPLEVEQKVIAVRNKTRLGPQRLSIYLTKYQDLQVPPGTIRHILRRNKDLLTYATPRRRKREKREFIDWYSAKPFEVVQMDIKYIRDQKALSKEQIIHLDKCGIPNYQWGALDVNSRFKLFAYSREKSWTNGLCFYLWVISSQNYIPGWVYRAGLTDDEAVTQGATEPFFGFFRDVCKHELQYYLSDVYVGMPSDYPYIIEAMRVTTDTPILVIDEVGFDRQDKPVNYAIEYLPGYHMQFSLVRKCQSS